MAETSTKLGRVSLVPRGEYDPQAQYHRLDVVQHNGSSYLALRDLQGVTPSDGTDYMLIAQAGAPGADGADGKDGADGAPGSSIVNIERTSGTGAAGTTDTYTITLTDGTTSTFQVYNGADGTGSGDMLKSIYDPQNKNKDVFADRVEAPGGAACDMPDSLGDGPYLIELTEDDPSEVSADQIGYDGTQSGIQAETVQGALDALDGEVDQLGAEMKLVSNEDILINSRWDRKENVVNQRNQNEYTTPGYTIDRWYVMGPLKVELHDDFLKISNIGTDIGFFNQNAEINELFSNSGNMVTNSALIKAEGTVFIYCGYNTSDNFYNLGDSLVPELNNFSVISYGYQSPVLDQVTVTNWQHFCIRIDPNAVVYLKAAKSELGSKQTLAHKEGDAWVMNDPPPNRALELLKCQRNYETDIHVTAFIDTELYDISVPYKVTKRINPSCTIVSNNGTVGKASYYAGNSWVDFDINSMEPNKSDVRIVFNNPSASSCHIAFSVIADASL